MKKENKFKRGRLIGYSAIALVAVSLTSVGFASWIIGGSTTSIEGNNISVEVADVVDKRVKIELVDSNNDLKIVFGPSVGDRTGNIQGDGSQDEDLKLQFGVKVTFSEGRKDDFKNLSFAVAKNINSTYDIEKAIKANYVSTPFSKINGSDSTKDNATYESFPLINCSWTESTNDNVVYEETNKGSIKVDVGAASTSNGQTSIIYTVKMTLSWGSAFGHQNPSIWGDTPDNTNTAVTALNNLKSGDCGFKIFLKHTVA